MEIQSVMQLLTSCFNLSRQVYFVLCVPCEISRGVLQSKPHSFFKRKQGILRKPVKTIFSLAQAGRY